MFVAILCGCLSSTKCKQNKAALGQLEVIQRDWHGTPRGRAEQATARLECRQGTAQKPRRNKSRADLSPRSSPIPPPCPILMGNIFPCSTCSLKPFQTSPPPTKMHHLELVAASITVPMTLTCLWICIPLLSSELCQRGLCHLYFSVLATTYRDGTR